MKEIVRVPITQQVVDAIKESILNGDFPVGKKLPSEQKLCEILSVSRSSVREAMRVLQAEGYLRLESGKGAIVLDNTSRDYNTVQKWFQEHGPKIEDYTAVREALEGLAASLAAVNWQEDALEALETTHEEFIKAEAVHNVKEMADLDERFHTQIAIMSQNPLLEKMNELLNENLRDYRLMSIFGQASEKNTIKEHQKIIDQIRQKSPDGARSAMLEHLAAVRSKVKSLA